VIINAAHRKLNPLMKRLSIHCALPAVLLTIPAAGVQAATIQAASCSYTNVSAAVNAAAIGDTVKVPAGSCTWSSTLSLNKGISLIGAGVGNTTITSAASGYLVSYDPADKAANALIRISGFTFDLGGGARSGLRLSSGNTLALQTRVRVDHNRFQNIGQGSTQYNFIWFAGTRGVVDSNYFTAAYQAIRNPTDPTNTNGRSYWNNYVGVILGAEDNNMYFEDNVFNVAGNGPGLQDTQEGSRWAFRYNTIYAPNGGQPLFDCHGNTGEGQAAQYSGMGGEIYGNNIIGGSGRALDQRGGRFFVFNNSFTTSGWTWQLREEVNDASAPVNYVGSGSQYPQHVNGTYIWGNRVNLTGSIVGYSLGPNCWGSSCFSTDIPRPGRDFFTESTSPRISCGPLGSRPASCTTGQAYWATNQSCTSLSGMVGTNPSSPITGTLYRCVGSNTWDTGRSPLAYPHPLRAGTTSTQLPPPVNLRTAQ
jgi:hypothetical protein